MANTWNKAGTTWGYNSWESDTVTISLTGVSATASPGNPSIEASSTLTLTGVEGTMSTGDLDITGWNVVDDSNSSISWTEVTKAA